MSTQPTHFWPEISTRTALILIVSVGFLVRLPSLERDLWYDESLSLFHARGANPLTKIVPNGPPVTSDLFRSDGGWFETLRAVSQIEQTPPLYFLSLRLWRKFFGESDRTLRLFSLVLGLVAILGIFLVGRESANAKVGLAAAGVLALLPLHIQYSQEVRAYGQAFLLATFASWAFLRVGKSLNQPRGSQWWVIYGSLTVLSLYTHYFTAGVFLAHGLSALVQPRSVRRPLVKGLGVVSTVSLILVIPWFFLQWITQFRIANLLEPRGGLLTFWSLDTVKRIVSLFGYFAVGWLPGMSFRSCLGIAILALYGIISLALPTIYRNREFRSAVIFGSLLFIMPLLFFAGVEATLNDSGLLLFPRFALPSLIGLCLLCGLVIASSRRRIVSFIVPALMVALTGYFQAQWQKVNSSSVPLPGLPWFYGNLSLAVHRISQQVRPNDLLLFDDPHLIVNWNAYEHSHVHQLLMTRKDFFSLNKARDFDTRWREVRETYPLIYLIRRTGEPPSEAVERLQEQYRLMSNERVGRLEIHQYVAPHRIM